MFQVEFLVSSGLLVAVVVDHPIHPQLLEEVVVMILVVVEIVDQATTLVLE
jgi:hypothetical protein|tara:strand:+ start:368 stop:520 length:153 start_codon:yes stop_codon:yes gene_type:complete